MNVAASSPIRVRAGNLTAEFFADELFLRYLRIGGVEALRGVYVALRDQNWNTLTPRTKIVAQSISAASFSIELEVDWAEGEIAFAGKCFLAGSDDDTISYRFEGVAQSLCRTNRLGFVALHGAQLAGDPVRLEHVDGSCEESHFPLFISPHQPFFDLRAVEHEVLPGCSLQVTFAGDTFETEDQRNWTDASFKTFCTPLSRPFPVELRPGATVEQSVELRLVWEPGLAVGHREAGDGVVRLSAAAEPKFHSVLRIGLEKEWGDNAAHTAEEIQFLKRLQLRHLRVEMRFAHSGWEDDLEAGLSLADALGTGLELALFLSDGCEPALEKLIERLGLGSVPVAQWLILHEHEAVPSRKLVELATRRIRGSGLGGLIATGTNANFTELNRNVPDAADCEGVCFAINPQVHAFDDLSLMETLPMHGQTARCAQELGLGRSALISPVTLTQRFNPVANRSETFCYSERPDERQQTEFGAAWTAGSLLHASIGGAYSASYFKTRGPTGVLKRSAKSESDLYPLFGILEWFGSLSSGALQPLESSEAMKVEAAAVLEEGSLSHLIINYDSEERTIKLAVGETGSSPTRLRRIGRDSEISFRETEKAGTLAFCLAGRSVAVLSR